MDSNEICTRTSMENMKRWKTTNETNTADIKTITYNLDSNMISPHRIRIRWMHDFKWIMSYLRWCALYDGAEARFKRNDWKWLVSFCIWTTAIIYVNALRNRIQVKTMSESTHQLKENCQAQLQEPSKLQCNKSSRATLIANGIERMWRECAKDASKFEQIVVLFFFLI